MNATQVQLCAEQYLKARTVWLSEAAIAGTHNPTHSPSPYLKAAHAALMKAGDELVEQVLGR